MHPSSARVCSAGGPLLSETHPHPRLIRPVCAQHVSRALTLPFFQVTTPGMFTENCVVLAEGVLVDGVFAVKAMGFPPPQHRTEALELIGPTLDLFKTGISPAQWVKVRWQASVQSVARFSSALGLARRCDSDTRRPTALTVCVVCACVSHGSHMPSTC